MSIQLGKAIIVSALIILIGMPFSVSAAPSAGIKPSSIFYFFDIAAERVSLFFTFNPQKKAIKALEYADERLAEAEAVAGDNNTEAVKTAMTNYESNIAFATEKSKDIGEKEKSEALLTTISDSTSRHQEVLADVLTKVPDEAKEAIIKAIEASKKGHEEALQKIAELKGEVEQPKQEVAELKAKDEEREKVIEELRDTKDEPSAAINTRQHQADTPAPQIAPTQNPSVQTKKPEIAQPQSSPTTETPKISIFTFPSGAVVEVDANGNIIRTIKEAPQQTYSEPATKISTPQSVIISLGDVQVTSGSAHIEWTTNIPTDSKLFLIQPSGSTKIVSSASGNSTIHFVDMPNLISGTTYKYTIEAIAGTQSKKIDGSFTTNQQTFTAESVKSPTNPNDIVPFLKLSSDRPFTIKKLVFLDDGTYCQSGYPFSQLTLQYLSQSKDAKKELTGTLGRFVFDFPDGLTSSGLTFRLSGGVNQADGKSSYCTNEGMKFILRDSESIVVRENGQPINVPHVVLLAAPEFSFLTAPTVDNVNPSGTVQFSLQALAKPWPSQTLTGKCKSPQYPDGKKISVWGTENHTFTSVKPAPPATHFINGAAYKSETGTGEHTCWFENGLQVSQTVTFTIQ